jgi:hypothetical protein
MLLENLLHSFPVDTGDVYVIAVFSEETTDGSRVVAVPRNCVFGENIAHSTFIVIFVVRAAVIAVITVITGRRVAISVTIAIVTIPVSVAGAGVGRIRIFRILVGAVCVGTPVPTPPRSPPPRKSEIADKDDFIETVEATKPIISIKVAVVETVKRSKAQA